MYQPFPLCCRTLTKSHVSTLSDSNRNKEPTTRLSSENKMTILTAIKIVINCVGVFRTSSDNNNHKDNYNVFKRSL